MADLINATDSLNLGRSKINAIIMDTNAAILVAGQATTKANSVQTQLDTIILADGASDAEVVQSRIGKDGTVYETLKNRLDSSEQQLEQVEPQLKSTPYLYQNMGMAFDSNDLSLSDYDTHASWPYSNVHWDSKINKLVVFYTIKPVHTLTNVRLLMRHMDTDYNFTEPTVIADGRPDNLALRSQGSAILPDGDYIVLMSRMNNTTFEQIGCDVYKSSDSGLTWSINEILIDGQPVKCNDGDMNGCIVLNSGRIITFALIDGSKLAKFLYSDDSGVTWQFSSWESGVYYNYSEPAFLELSNGTVIAYLRPNGGGVPTDAIPEKAIFTKSLDGGATWTNPVQSTSILDFTQGNGQLLLDKSAGRVEFLHYSRHKKIDNKSSIYQSIASEMDAENDNFGQANRIIRFNRTDNYDGKIGDGGYVGACFLPDKRIVGFYYTGIKTSANICYFVGKRGAKENVNYSVEEVYGRTAKFVDENTVATKTEVSDIYGSAGNIVPLDETLWGQGTFKARIGSVEAYDNVYMNSARIRLNVKLPIRNYLKYRILVANPDYVVSVRQYDAGNIVLADTSWKSSYSLTPHQNAIALCMVVKRVDKADLTPADIDSIGLSIDYQTIEDQLNSKLSAMTMLYEEGREKPWLTGGWVIGTPVNSGTAVKNSDNFQASFDLANNIPGKQGFMTTNSIDVTNISKIKAVAQILSITGICDVEIVVYNKSNPISNSDGRLLYAPFTSLGVNEMVLDVSALTGSVWIAVNVAKGSTYAGAINAKVYQVWMEK